MTAGSVEVSRGFDTAEFEQRTTAIQASMHADNLDVLLFTTEPDVRYYSGFYTQFWQSPTRPWFLLVPSSGKPVAVIPGIGEACMRRTWLDDIRCWSSPHPDDDGVQLLVQTIKELSGNSGRVGMLKGRESSLRMPLHDFDKLCFGLGNVDIIDTTPMVQAQRQVKSEAEIAKISAACNASGGAFDEIASIVKTGDSERQIFQRFKHLCLTHGADDVSYLVGAAGHAGYDDIISPPSDRQTQAGDILILDTGCVVDGYFCDYDRNFALEHSDAATKDAYRTTHAAVDAALAMVRPGVTCADIYTAMQSVLCADGDSKMNNVGRLGHGLGMQLTESPSITSFDHTEMKPGMVMTLEPGLPYGDGKIMVHEENIVIREDGAHLLSKRASAEIPVIG